MAYHHLRSKIIAGNWKMYKTIEEAKSFVETLASQIKGRQAGVYLAVPFTAIYPVAQLVNQLKALITIGAQNMNDAREGAFTGEIAGKMLKEAGAQFVILGHSERRRLFHEDDAMIHRKVIRALAEGIQPLVCIGESLEERESGHIETVLRQQIENCLKDLPSNDLSKIILAYEPIWAIGTGKQAQPEEIQRVHAFCRHIIQEHWGEKIGDRMAIQYGGSVKPENAADILAQSDVDGLLIGGASLSVDDFSQMIDMANQLKMDLTS